MRFQSSTWISAIRSQALSKIYLVRSTYCCHASARSEIYEQRRDVSILDEQHLVFTIRKWFVKSERYSPKHEVNKKNKKLLCFLSVSV